MERQKKSPYESPLLSKMVEKEYPVFVLTIWVFIKHKIINSVIYFFRRIQIAWPLKRKYGLKSFMNCFFYHY